MALDAYVAEGYVSETVKIEPELIELDAAGFALLGHPSSSLRKEAMKLLSTTKELFYAYKAAYDRAVSDAHALEEFLVGRRSALEVCIALFACVRLVLPPLLDHSCLIGAHRDISHAITRGKPAEIASQWSRNDEITSTILSILART